MRMQFAPPKQYTAANHRALANADAIEWETMPSVLDAVVQPRRAEPPARTLAVARALHDAWFGETTAWDLTRPAGLDELGSPTSPSQSIDGLEVQEVGDPETFLRYFSTPAPASTAQPRPSRR